MLGVAKRLCQLVATYGSVISTLYPANAPLIAALAAANAACGVLATELAAVRETGD